MTKIFHNRSNLNSRNSIKPPSSDKNHSREKRNRENKRKAGVQPGSVGITLRQVDDPDEIEMLTID
ncbi:MAG: hypothetical protein KDF59_15470 [Nitrosomonas sp.]|nr:hypothetical protein [Nitrosomonas sp.]